MGRKVQRVIGLMSGTSADGIDAALADIRATDAGVDVRLVDFVFTPYPSDLRQKILDLCDVDRSGVDEVCRMHAVLGEWFARAALSVCRESGIALSEVDLIGSHGQTVHHLPDPVEVFGTTVRSTLQLGDPSVIAERTGVTTVADFRTRDVAAGGQGAPLVPVVDYLLFRSERTGRVMLNIGGIANVTVLPAGCSLQEVFAFDTGPGNMVIDALVGMVTGGAQHYDRGGALAGVGRVSADLLARLMQHPFLGLPPPKSTGRETFGKAFVEGILTDRGTLLDADLIRTATVYTACSIADALERYVRPVYPIGEVVVSGGGAENPLVMAALQDALPGVEVLRTERLGLPSEAKEAVAFAVLAHETLAGRAGNIPRVTGAAHGSVLGVVAPGRGCRISVDSMERFW